MILHAELVLAVDDDVRARVRIAVLDEHVLDHVPLLMELRGIRLQCRAGIRNRRQRFIPHRDRARRKARFFRGLRRNDRDRLADVADLAARENRLVELHEAEELARGQIARGDDRLHAAHLLRGGRVDPGDPRIRMRAAERRAEEHSFATEIAAVLEFALGFGRAVGPLDRLADAAADSRSGSGRTHRRYIALDARSTASSIFP